MSSSHAIKQTHDWLPMPSGLSFTDDSFTIDLLKQFDKRRSQLLNSDTISIQQEEEESIHHSSNNSIITPSIHHSIPKEEENIIRRSSSSIVIEDRFHHNATRQIEQPRAATTFNSWTLKKKKKFHNNNRHVQEIFNEPLSKIAINTTISISPNNINNQFTENMIQPPIITQYPPKPLKYSPVEPLPNAGSNHYNRNTLKRLSLPLLKMTAASQATNTLQRRRSDSDLLNQGTNNNTTFLSSITKKWNKLILTCKSKKVKNKRPTA